MTTIVFENDVGQLKLGGGRNEAWRITEISGCGMVTKSFQTAKYFTDSGHRTIGERKEARVITIAGDVSGGKLSAKRRISEAIKILDKEGWLTLRTSGKARRIRARCTNFEQGERYGSYFRFVMQLCCDCPYFEEIGSDTIALFERTKELETTFTLPQAFSSRKSEGTVINNGDVEAEPVFDIYFGIGTENGEKITLTLYNETSKKQISLVLYPNVGDTVTVDIAKRAIYNSRGENLLTSLSEGGYLKSFVLKKGTNVLRAVCDTSTNMSIVCRFTNRYLEAVC